MVLPLGIALPGAIASAWWPRHSQCCCSSGCKEKLVLMEPGWLESASGESKVVRERRKSLVTPAPPQSNSRPLEKAPILMTLCGGVTISGELFRSFKSIQQNCTYRQALKVHAVVLLQPPHTH
eukprot:4844571-Amphidinium_carterae.1